MVHPFWGALSGLPARGLQRRGKRAAKGQAFVINGLELFALDRETGQLRWQYTLDGAATTPPVAPPEHLYVGLAGRGLAAYQLPVMEAADMAQGGTGSQTEGSGMPSAAGPKSLMDPDVGLRNQGRFSGILSGAIGPRSGGLATTRTIRRGPQPSLLFTFSGGGRLELPPLVTGERVLLSQANGVVVGIPRTVPREVYSVITRGDITTPAAHYGEMAYVASGDFAVYALQMSSGRTNWRFLAGVPILSGPLTFDEDLYITGARLGLFRLDRSSGKEIWSQPVASAVRFLAANPKLVYAFDANGRLLVLDRKLGRTLSVYDGTRDFVVPITNYWTDRLFLAAPNGLLVCLHDRDYRVPVSMKKIEDNLPGTPKKEEDKGPAEKVPPKPRAPKNGEKPAPKEEEKPAPKDKTEDVTPKEDGDKPAPKDKEEKPSE